MKDSGWVASLETLEKLRTYVRNPILGYVHTWSQAKYDSRWAQVWTNLFSHHNSGTVPVPWYKVSGFKIIDMGTCSTQYWSEHNTTILRRCPGVGDARPVPWEQCLCPGTRLILRLWPVYACIQCMSKTLLVIRNCKRPHDTCCQRRIYKRSD